MRKDIGTICDERRFVYTKFVSASVVNAFENDPSSEYERPIRYRPCRLVSVYAVMTVYCAHVRLHVDVFIDATSIHFSN